MLAPKQVRNWIIINFLLIICYFLPEEWCPRVQVCRHFHFHGWRWNTVLQCFTVITFFHFIRFRFVSVFEILSLFVFVFVSFRKIWKRSFSLTAVNRTKTENNTNFFRYNKRKNCGTVVVLIGTHSHNLHLRSLTFYVYIS